MWNVWTKLYQVTFKYKRNVAGIKRHLSPPGRDREERKLEKKDRESELDLNNVLF